MSLFLLAGLAVIAAALAWLTHRLVWVPKWRVRWLRWAVPVVVVVLTGLSFLQLGAGLTALSPAAARPLAWAGAVWLAAFFYLGLGAVGLSVLSLLVGVGARLGGVDRARRRAGRVRLHRFGVPLIVASALVVTGVGVIRAGEPKVTPVSVFAGDLPAAFDGVTVALVTDLHAGPVRSAAFTQEVVDTVNAAHPDLVLLAGDLVDGPVGRYGPEIVPLSGLRAPLGVYAVTGNHEMYTGSIAGWEQEWRTLGITVLNNAAVPVARGGDRIWIGGVNDWSGVGAFAPDYRATLAGIAPKDFALVMAHQPRAATNLDPRLVDLQVSGHTHGGQLWPVRYLVPLQQPMVDGYAVVNGIPVLTSRGVGTWGPPVRVAADPQIPLITLRRD